MTIMTDPRLENTMGLTKRLSILLILLAALGCNRGPAQVRMVVSNPDRTVHAVKLAQAGGATGGNLTFVAIFRGNPPEIGQIVNIEDVCYVFTAYRAGAWKMAWESSSVIGLAIDGPLSRDYEEMIEQYSCDGITSRWFYERKPSA